MSGSGRAGGSIKKGGGLEDGLVKGGCERGRVTRRGDGRFGRNEGDEVDKSVLWVKTEETTVKLGEKRMMKNEGKMLR